MNLRTLAFAAAAVLASGCTAVTAVDTDFLNITDPEEDASPPDCTDVHGLVETGENCWDRCDNDDDGAIDCEDSECESYCCPEGRIERLSCADGCDNDHDLDIDCADSECTGATHCTPAPVLEGVCRGTPDDPDCCAGGASSCCSNALDDDGDGLIDCADPNCAPTDFCCGNLTAHVDQANRELDGDYWEAFGGASDPEWNSYDRVAEWNDDGTYAGAVTLQPLNLDFGLRFSFNVAVTEESTCYMPWDCEAFSGIALGPAPAPGDGELPAIHLSVLVTSARRVVVTRGPIGQGRILHTIGMDAPPPGYEGPPVVYTVIVDLMPASDEYGENGYRMRLSVPLGREVCHDDGSIIGCPEEPEWESDELVLYEENNVLISEERGAYLLVLGHGAGVEYSDHAGETTSVELRGCANPTAWEPVGDPSNDDDDRLTNASLCWAVAGLGSGSIARVSQDPPGYAMVVEGTTEEVHSPGMGTTNFSLGFLTTEGDEQIASWDQSPIDGNLDELRFSPIDTDRDLNCMGLVIDDYSDPTCEIWGDILYSPSEPDDLCLSARSHRSPHLIDVGHGSYRVLYSEAVTPTSLSYEISAADYTPRLAPEDRWSPLGDEHRLTTEEVLGMTERAYSSLRDPVAFCHPFYFEDDACGGVYMVLVVGEPSSSSGDPWTGDELIYVEYDIDQGFNTDRIAVTLGTTYARVNYRPELNPLIGRYLAEPWIELYDDGVNPRRYFVWVTTTQQPFITAQVDLLIVAPTGFAESSLPLVIDDDEDGLSGATWTLYPGSPVLTVRDLELLYSSTDYRAADCSGSCQIGGVTGVVVPATDSGRDRLHLWVSVAERPALDLSARYHLRHLVQPFGLP